MNFADMQKAAQTAYGKSPSLTDSSSDSSSDDEDSLDTCKKSRSTKSVNESQEKLLMALLRKHGPRDGKAWRTIAISAAFWGSGVYYMAHSQSVLSVFLVSFTIVRNFMILHDACHLSFFRSGKHNVRLAKILQFFSQFEWSTWQSTHNHHHHHLGDNSVIDTSLTVWFSEEDYANMPLKFKLPFRLIRDPILFFPIASAWVFFISRPIIQFLPRYTVPAILYYVCGFKTFLLYNCAGWLAGIIGLALFHLQHQVNTPYRVSKDRKSMIDAGLYGSTLLAIRWPFTLITLGIEFHHIHHASTRVPGYNLADCHKEGESLGLFDGINRVGGHRAFVSMFHALFKGNTKCSHADHHDANHELPSFVTFWPYSALGLYDQS